MSIVAGSPRRGERPVGLGLTASSFLVTTLPGWLDLSLLRAARRAGATAVVNLEAVAPSAARASLASLAEIETGRIGARVDAAAALDSLEPNVLDVVIVSAAVVAADPTAIGRLRTLAREILVECTTAADTRLVEPARVDGVIAKGHESGGRVGDETTFVLLQRLLGETDLPVYAHGGIGCHTLGACTVAGCEGVVLDAQLALARESTLPDAVKDAVRRMDGDETVCLGREVDDGYRVYRRPGFEAVEALQRLEVELSRGRATGVDVSAAWQEAIRGRINWRGVGAPLWPIGQDAALARTLARRFRSVSGILAGLSSAAAGHVTSARRLRPFDRGAPLAVAHRTEYPILQGPMTRVSDTPGFAEAVARAGGLPFLALALLRGSRVRALLAATKELLVDRPWGVGILGFVPNDLRAEQLQAIEECRPPFALIAGGRPDQAAKLEAHGIPTYLHVPAPSLLQMFLGDGARRFVFEGRECGGHVGPRTSFVLWESMVDTLLGAVAGGVPATDLHVVFAGGIHDARSSAMVATIAAPLAELGVNLGVLMGTAYVFTEEAVGTGAIVEGFQDEAVRCSRTALVESGPGHATRCADTAFVSVFRDARLRLMEQGVKADDVRLELERLNLGRLRLASKGVARREGDGGSPAYEPVDREHQRAEGMYMIGQVAALRSATCRVADLHRAVSIDGSALLGDVDASPVPAGAEPAVSPTTALSARIAIVGVGCLLPHAPDAHALWRNILGKTDVIDEIPGSRFDVARYFDPDRRARDKIYSKWGGFLEEIPFDPVKYGIPPSAVPSIDPFQLLTLEVVSQAIDDAGYRDREFDRERASVILGASGGVGELGYRYGIRSGLPTYVDSVDDETLARLPEWTEDSFAGVLLNVAAGRVANRLNLGGLNFTIDAACASSLAAVYVAARELESGGSDMVIVGGFDTSNSPFGFQCFSSAQALSPTGRCRTFDDAADGIAISEGLVALVLKRVEDAERDGDRIYAVIRSVAGSSDGRGKGLMAPKPEGQMRVLQRAYAAAGFSPATIGLVEAHGTGTVAGDAAEVSALSHVFAAAGAPAASVALGSIKSMIGHTKSAAGVSGLLKVALALHHKVIPPTLHVTTPNARLREADNPFFVPVEPLPWIAATAPDQPRRAAVSSFGFGGTNFHVVLEEYDRLGPGVTPETAPVETWPAEVAYWTSACPEQLLETLQRFEERVSRAPDVPLRSLAAAVCRSAHGSPGDRIRLAIVTSSTSDLRGKVSRVSAALSAGRTHVSDAEGVYMSEGGPAAGKIAFLFPGQGSQYPGMHRDVSLCFPDVRHALEVANRVTSGHWPRALSTYVFPPSAFTAEQARQQESDLTDTVVAQPALGAVETGLCQLLARLGVRPDMTAGHSYGEYVALSVAGAFSSESLFALSAARGLAIKNAANGHPGTMAAVSASPEVIAQVLGQPDDVWVANLNSPRQTVLAGSTGAIDVAVTRLSDAGLPARRIPVACAFHSPLVQAAGRSMAELLAHTEIRTPVVPVFSNTLAAPYPADPSEIRAVLSEHITAPVRFAEQVEAMHREGARIFIEVGPRSVLSNLVRETLAHDRPLIVPMDARDRHGVTQLLHVLAQLGVAGVPIDFAELWRGRDSQPVQLGKLVPATPLPEHVWLVSGGRARRQQEPLMATSRPSDERPVLHGGLMHSDSSTPVPQFVVEAGSADVMRQFQQLMGQFLQTQALVMTAYLRSDAAADVSSASLAVANSHPWVQPAALPRNGVSPSTVVPATGPLPAPAVSTPLTVTPTSVSQPAPTPVVVHRPSVLRESAVAAKPTVLARLLEIVSDRTGYPQDMLSVDVQMEADLGIDSIKRMEILTAFQQMYAGAERGAFQAAMERLSVIKTLRETATVLEELVSAAAPAEAAAASAT